MRKLLGAVIVAGLILGAVSGSIICMIAMSAGMMAKILYLGLGIIGLTTIVAYPAMRLLAWFGTKEGEEMDYEAEHAV